MKVNNDYCGMNLYRATYRMDGSEIKFGKLVVAKSMGEVEEEMTGSTISEFSVEIVETDISLSILDEGIQKITPSNRETKHGFKIGDHVLVFDRNLFAIPLRAVIVIFSQPNDGVSVVLQESNNPKYKVGCNVWVHAQQLVHQDQDVK